MAARIIRGEASHHHAGERASGILSLRRFGLLRLGTPNSLGKKLVIAQPVSYSIERLFIECLGNLFCNMEDLLNNGNPEVPRVNRSHPGEQ